MCNNHLGRRIIIAKAIPTNKDAKTTGPLGLGKLELEVMQFVWQQEEAGKKEIADKDAITAIYPKQELADMAISAAFVRLEQKGWLAQVKEVDRTFHYKSMRSRREVGEQLMDWVTKSFLMETLTGAKF